MRSRTSFAIPSLCLILALAPVTILADKVTLANGDVLTGQIVKLEKEVLHVTYYGKSLEIPWAEVTGVESAGVLHVVLQDGQTLVGTVRTSDTGYQVATSRAGTVSVTKDSIQIVRSEQEEAAYRDRTARLSNPGLLDLWSGFLDTGLATTQGNAQSTTFNLGFNAARTSPRDKISVFVTSLYARSNTSGASLTTANAIRGGVRYDVNVNPRLFAFGFTELDYDEFQGLDLRFVPGAGLGVHWFKSDDTRFDVFGGGSLNREFYRGDIRRTSGELVMGEELSHRIFKAMHFDHKLSFFPNMSETGEYRFNLDNALVTRLSSWLSLQLSLSDRLNSTPMPGKKKNDVLFTTGLRFTFQ